MTRIKKILFALILAALFLPLSYQIHPWVGLVPLKGVTVEPKKPELTTSNWWSGLYQQNYSSYYEYHIGLRPLLIRLRNQLYYWFYHQSTTYVVPGRDGQFFSWDYWASYRGLDFVGKDSVEARAERIGQLRDQLNQTGKELLVVMAPNKVRYMPENLPERLDKSPGSQTNYECYRNALERTGIPVLDFNEDFIKAKDTVLTPLFANTSIHWSGYGMHLAINAIIETLESLGQRNHINLGYTKWETMDSSISSDRDMVDLMNLLLPPDTEELAFPVYSLNSSGDACPVKLLLIGDSFFWNFYSFPVRYQIFAPESRFWYYNRTQMDLSGNRTPVETLSATRAVSEVDYVVILATEANLDRFPYGFPADYLGELKRL